MVYLSEEKIKSLVGPALLEDIGSKDITTEAVIPKDKYIKAALVAKEECVVCGLEMAEYVFKRLDKNAKFQLKVKDGDTVRKGQVIAYVYGKARCILSGERVALNFLSLLSGIASTTREYVLRIRSYKAIIMDTRKTIPGLRSLEKYAVTCGGGFNHRFALDDMVLIKENHVRVMGDGAWVIGLKDKIQKIRKRYPSIKIEIEVENLNEFGEALKAGPDIIMLDNMNISDIKKAVKIKDLTPNTPALPALGFAERRAGRQHPTPKLEASGGINLGNVRQIAATGVDMISIGALTHSINSVDISLEIL